MKPITSSSATGSFIPDSPSSERASRFSRVERRSTAKIAAESVAAIAAPTSIPSSSAEVEDPVRREPGDARRSATVPTVASEAAVPSTGRISDQPAVSPPSKRIRTRAIVPRVRASSASSNSIPPIPSEPASIPRPRKSSSPGIRTRSASSAPTMPAASRRAGDQDQLGVVSTHRWTLDRDAVETDPRSTFRRSTPARLELLGRARLGDVLGAFVRAAVDQVEQGEEHAGGEQ